MYSIEYVQFLKHEKEMLTAERESQMMAKKESSRSFFHMYAKDAEQRIPSIANEMPKAQQEYDDAKQKMTNSVHSISEMNRELLELTEKANEVVKVKKQEIETFKKDVKEMNEKVSQERTLFQLRKEQADSLNRKRDGNLHSSWMGLFRPLKEESRPALIIVALFFGIIAVLLLVFAFQKGLLNFGMPTDFQVPDSFDLLK
jgi:hypothetical protein